MITQLNDAEVFYHLQPSNPAAHLFSVTCRIARPDPEGQVVSLPAWAPGSYLIREYARHVVSLEMVTASERVPLHKLDKAHWRAPVVDGPLVLQAEIYAFDLSVRGAYLDAEHAFINGFCLFLRPEGLADQPCAVQIDPPPGDSHWQLATAMRRLSGSEMEFGAFAAQSYDELIDQPMLLGDLQRQCFDVLGVPHELVVQGCEQADLERVSEDLKEICTAQSELFGDALPMSHYSFLTTALNAGYGGLEHRDSCALVCSRGDLPRAGDSEANPRYRKFLGLCSHEYFHLWNVKRLRPAELTPYALDRENYTRQLWLFEGITSYYDDLMLARSGVVTSDEYLQLLGQSLTRVYRSRGRRLQSLEEASFDTWIKFYRQDENSANALVSYYTKGAMVALALDLELRLRSSGAVSLDDVMRAFWQEYGEADHGVPQGAFERIAEEASGLRLEEFFEQNLRGNVDPPIAILLAQFAVRLQMRAAESATDSGGTVGKRPARPRPWLGVNTQVSAGRVLVANVLSDGPALQAGVSAGDEIIAINGERVNAENFEAIQNRLREGEPAKIHVFRRDDLRELDLEPVRPPRDTAYLELDANADHESLERRLQWLGI